MPNRRLVTIVIFTAFSVMGIASSTLGPTLPNLAAALAIPLASAGILRASQQVGSLFAGFAAGRALDRYSTRIILVPGMLLMAAGLFSLIASTGPAGGLLSSAIFGIGVGFLNLGANVAIGFLYESNASSVLSALHMCFGLGLVGGPLIAAWALSRPDGWRLAYVIPTVLCIVLGLVFCRESMNVKLRVLSAAQTQSHIPILWLSLLPLIILLFMYNGAGNGFADWIATHLRLAAGASVEAASSLTSLYGLSLTLGRIISIGTLRKFGNVRVLTVAVAIATVGAALVVLAGAQVGLVAAGVLLVGVGFGPLYPTVIAMGGQLQPELRGTVTGILAGIASLGGITIPFLQGQVGGGRNGGMIVTFVATLVMIGSLVLLRLVSSRPLAHSHASS